MKRKLIKQGKGSLTISLPKEWIDYHELNPGDSIDVNEEGNDLVIKSDSKKTLKGTEIKLDYQSKESYRSLIGSLYRGGYDIINVKFDDNKILDNLQKAVESIYGFELMYIEKDSCVIKSIYDKERTEIKSHIKRIIYTVKTIQKIIIDDINDGEFDSFSQIQKLRDNVLKNRDLIIRVIKKQKLLDNSNFPYYTITLSLWGVVRNYYKMYENLEGLFIDDKSIELLNETNNYVKKLFSNIDSLNKDDFLKRHNLYENVYELALDCIKNKKINSLIPSFCLNIIIDSQLSDSYTYLLNHKD